MFGGTEQELLNFHNLISDNVKTIRKKRKLTQLDLSIELGFKDSSFISHVENINKPKHHYSIEHLYLLAKFFNVSVCDFFKEKK